MSKPENPPAFPVAQLERNGEIIIFADTGMTLRDWFAGQALNGIIYAQIKLAQVTPVDEYDEQNAPAKIAYQAFEIADAMLTEHEKGRNAQ